MNLIEIGQAILISRKAYRITQETLASNAGVSRYTLIKLENGQATDIQFKVLTAILSELHLNLIVTDKPVSGIAVLGDKTV